MKKLILIALFSLAAFPSVAQVKFHPGIRIGANFSKFTGSGTYDDYYYDSNATYRDYSFKTDFYVGFEGRIRFTKRYALQPELTYSRQGSEFKRSIYDYNTDSYTTYETKGDLGYMSLGIINKLYIVDKFHFLAGPTLDIQVNHSRNLDIDVPFDFGFVAGFGSEITENFGIEARVKKGILPVIDNADENTTNLVFSIGGTFTFF
ncbi:porin family protein [Flavobacterium silvaticum]|uniref:PorT family protein n=1 Tax=Flavobacterium silvaticum TaxID=1852020 RepID=A0A972JF89_9FLAO|nr:porin family protein [Flavobacterium silvaticum]NMH27704.1 PorT family protein [Flavobacterium silvaticum]